MLLFSAPLDFDRAVLVESDLDITFPSLLEDATGVVADIYRRRITALVCSPAENRYIDDAELALYPNLHTLATASTGTNHIDLAACARRGIKVLSLLDDRDGLNTISASAEWTFKLILEGLRLKRPYHELAGKKVRMVGYGRIGQRIEDWSQAMGAGTGWYDPHYDGEYFIGRYDNLPWLFSHADIVVVCCALTPETTGMIGYDLLKRLRRDAVLVNTARGEVIDADALEQVMPERPDLRVCVDVVHGEVTGTAAASRERLRALGAYVTPHIAGETFESRTKAARIILGLLKQHALERGPTTAVSPTAGVLADG